MAIVSMRCPRSDIYQLLDQLTLLFYGEIVYSGSTNLFFLMQTLIIIHRVLMSRTDQIHASLLQSNWIPMSGYRKSGSLLL